MKIILTLLGISIGLATFGISTFLGHLASFTQAQTIPLQQSESSSQDALTLLRTGQDKFQRQDYRGAISDLNRAVLLDPNESDIYFNRGLIRFQLEDELGALSDFDATVALDPRHARGYLYRASVLFTLGSPSEAIVDLQQAAQLFSEQKDRVGYNKAMTLIKHFNSTLVPPN